jgi:hypothetical protein
MRTQNCANQRILNELELALPFHREAGAHDIKIANARQLFYASVSMVVNDQQLRQSLR